MSSTNNPNTVITTNGDFSPAFVLQSSTRTIHSSFVGASSADGTFSDHIDSPEVLGRIDVGV